MHAVSSMAVFYSSEMSCFPGMFFNNFLACSYGSSCPYCYWCHFCLYISHTLYFYCDFFINILLLLSILIFHFCVCISHFLFQLPRSNNITITSRYRAWNVKNFVLNVSRPGHTSCSMCLGLWIL